MKIKAINNVLDWYSSHEKSISSLALVGGFIFDSLTLKRIDMFWENIWVIFHIVVVSICIIFIHRIEREEDSMHNPAKLHFWLVNIMQFFFGGLLGTYLVFYFRSATLSVAWPFILVLLLALYANERLKHHFEKLYFQLGLLFLSLISFSIFLVPVLLHTIGPFVFYLSTVVSLVFILSFIYLVFLFGKENFQDHRKLLVLYIGGIFVTVNILYIFNLIPPIPLSLKDAGIYHMVEKNNNEYILTGEVNSWKDHFIFYKKVNIVSGERLYAYSSIFSPTKLNTSIVHIWQKYDEETNKWITMSKVNLALIGGRDGGFRTYSLKENITPGKWRVSVETMRGQVIGRLLFRVSVVEMAPVLVHYIKS